MKEKPNTRYLSLDVLRGLTVALMIIVNTPGSWETIYAPFLHAAWHGFTPTDWVFPTFLFVVGNAMSFSLQKYELKSESSFLRKVFKRTAIIFLIGLLLNIFPFFTISETGDRAFTELSSIRIMGVLQRIALCYCLASLMLRYLKLTGTVMLNIFILLFYWGILYFFGNPSDPYSLQGNAALKLDLFILGENHLYKGEGIPFDPEGILSTFPSVVNVISGYLVGRYIQSKGNNKNTVVKLAVAGLLSLILAVFWDLAFPINKKIWTSSYVLYTVGWDLIVLAILIFIIEVNLLKKWTYFFEVFGKNTLFIYILADLVIMIMFLIRVKGQSLNDWIYTYFFKIWVGPYTGSLLFAITYMLVIWLAGFWMDKRKIYVKV